jgi:uncharacterized coiled-coil protein SlyX
MAVSRSHPLLLVVLFVTGVAVPTWAQNARQTYDPAFNGRPSKPRDGFIDFTLKRINPAETDYGQMISEGRSLAIAETVENAYFWSNVVSLGLLGCLFILVLYQQNRLNRSGWRTADALVQLQHALARANSVVEGTQQQNQRLTDSLSALRESALRTTLPPADSVADSGSASVTRATAPQKTSVASGHAEMNLRSTGSATVRKSSGESQIALFAGDGDLVMKVNSQEQQIVGLQDQLKLLRRQLTDYEKRLRAEQEKNRALKGN